MRYLGGKSRLARKIANVLVEHIGYHTHYYEPFVGGGSVLSEFSKLAPNLPKTASDIHSDLILMWKAIQENWKPPTDIDESLYKKLKNNPPSPLRGFVGFACSFGGKWFHGYARGRPGDNYAKQSRNSLLRKCANIQNCQFLNCDYSALNPENSLIYCDPPYANRTGYANKNFDHALFWNTLKGWKERGNTIIVSEYTAPPDIKLLTAFERNQELRSTAHGRKSVKDCLFVLKTLPVSQVCPPAASDPF